MGAEVGSGIRSLGQSHSSEPSAHSGTRLQRADSGTHFASAQVYSPYLQPRGEEGGLITWFYYDLYLFKDGIRGFSKGSMQILCYKDDKSVSG